MGIAGYSEAPFKYAHITTATTTTLKTAPSVLHAIVINAPGTTNTITINDGAGGATIGVITTPATVGQTIIYDVGTNVGLSIVTGAACDLTVVYS